MAWRWVWTGVRGWECWLVLKEGVRSTGTEIEATLYIALVKLHRDPNPRPAAERLSILLTARVRLL